MKSKYIKSCFVPFHNQFPSTIFLIWFHLDLGMIFKRYIKSILLGMLSNYLDSFVRLSHEFTYDLSLGFCGKSIDGVELHHDLQPQGTERAVTPTNWK